MNVTVLEVVARSSLLIVTVGDTVCVELLRTVGWYVKDIVLSAPSTVISIADESIAFQLISDANEAVIVHVPIKKWCYCSVCSIY